LILQSFKQSRLIVLHLLQGCPFHVHFSPAEFGAVALEADFLVLKLGLVKVEGVYVCIWNFLLWELSRCLNAFSLATFSADVHLDSGVVLDFETCQTPWLYIGTFSSAFSTSHSGFSDNHVNPRMDYFQRISSLVCPWYSTDATPDKIRKLYIWSGQSPGCSVKFLWLE
jgi:hypothetical protein